MTPYCEEYYKMAKEFHLNLKHTGYICSWPYIHPADFILKFLYYKDMFLVAGTLIDCGECICCYGALELRPKQARQQLAKLMGQYKEILVKRKLKTIEKDFK